MKIGDIKVGEQYLLDWMTCAQVIETRVERTSRTGSIRRDGVKVKVKSTSIHSGYSEGEERVVMASHLRQKWSEYQAEIELEEKRQQVRRQQFEKAREQAEKLNELFAARGIELAHCNPGIYSGNDFPDTQIRMSNDAMLKLTALLEALPEGTVQLDQPGSALDKLFGR